MLQSSAVFLRLPLPADAKCSVVWDHCDLSESVERVEARIARWLKSANDPQDALLLVVCRRSNQRPVGSVRIRLDGARFARIEPVADPRLDADQRATIIAEAVSLVVRWLFEEYSLMTAAIHTAGWHPLIEEALSCWPGRRAYVLRQYLFVDGRYEDAHVWQVFDQAWIDRLGAPPWPDPGSRELLPVRRKVTPISTLSFRPPDAFAVGERVHLRPFRKGEGDLVARWSMEESEDFRPNGRSIHTAHNYEAFHSRQARVKPPAWLRFAVALNETGELIGCNGLDMISWVHRHATSEVEYFRAEHRSKGYGTESGTLIFDHGFKALGLNSITAFVSDRNERSIAASRKRGFRVAGYLAWRTFASGGLGGYHVLDLLRSDWLAEDSGDLEKPQPARE